MFIKYLNTSNLEEILMWNFLNQVKSNYMREEKSRQANQTTRHHDNLIKWSCSI